MVESIVAELKTPFQSTESIEITLLIDAIYYAYGYDFRNYAFSSKKRRLDDLKSKYRFHNYAEMQHKILHDREFFYELLSRLTITVTEFYRDPYIYQLLKNKVFDHLKTYPKIKIWHAGCATGEEVYSLAILLQEAGLYERCIIYATDINPLALDTARAGAYSLERIKKGSEQYFQAGGQFTLAEYYSTNKDQGIIKDELKTNIVFSDHNLATDQYFGEMQLILCRNVMIYFNNDLTNRSLGVFDKSLCPGGFLVLGNKETLSLYDIAKDYEELDKKGKIYCKKWKH